MKKRFSILVSVLMFCILLSPMFVQANEYQGKAEEFDQTGEKYQSASEVFRKEEVEELIEQVGVKYSTDKTIESPRVLHATIQELLERIKYVKN